jgi:DNA-binding GntR family transcriptional regulator
LQKLTGLPNHEVIYRNIRDRVLFGDFVPGQSVTIQGLVDRFEGSITPVREAIRRLIAEGALEFQGNRRISVPRLDENRFSELEYARVAIGRSWPGWRLTG